MASVAINFNTIIPEIGRAEIVVDSQEFYVADKGFVRINLTEDMTVNVPLCHILSWSRRH